MPRPQGTRPSRRPLLRRKKEKQRAIQPGEFKRIEPMLKRARLAPWSRMKPRVGKRSYEK